MGARKHCADCGGRAAEHESGKDCRADVDLSLDIDRESDARAKDRAETLKVDTHLDNERGFNR